MEVVLRRLAREPAVLVRVHATRGSVPREVGAWMAVFAKDALGSVGGGHLELQATQIARAHLDNPGALPEFQRYALGPSLGQCCGGDVQLRFEYLTAADAATLSPRLMQAHAPVVLFGGGHVGQALVRVLSTLPLKIHWIDSRDEVFPADIPAHVACDNVDPVQSAVVGLAPGACVLIMSFSHAEDLELVAACLLRQRQHADLRYIGLIGSRTKWARFRARLRERGYTDDELDAVTSPIGVPGIAGKQPEVIAVAVAAQILQCLSAYATG
jgi:xanthine dehydrogenase accessory factor